MGFPSVNPEAGGPAFLPDNLTAVWVGESTTPYVTGTYPEGLYLADSAAGRILLHLKKSGTVYRACINTYGGSTWSTTITCDVTWNAGLNQWLVRAQHVGHRASPLAETFYQIYKVG
jgi:hypothetical protein